MMSNIYFFRLRFSNQINRTPLLYEEEFSRAGCDTTYETRKQEIFCNFNKCKGCVYKSH